MQTHPDNLLESLDSPQGDQAKDQFVASLRSTFDGLVTLLADAGKQLESTKRIDPGGPAFRAIEILRFARYPGAAAVCVRHLDARSTAFPAVSDEREAHFPHFPFAVALAAIGTPPIIAELTETLRAAEPAATRFQLSCLVMKEAIGDDLTLLHLANVLQGTKLEQANHIVQKRTNLWDAKYCSDYASR